MEDEKVGLESLLDDRDAMISNLQECVEAKTNEIELLKSHLLNKEKMTESLSN